MHQQSRNTRNIKTIIRPTRAAEKIVFNIPTRCTTKYLTQIWNNLTEGIQRMENIKRFEKCVAEYVQ